MRRRTAEDESEILDGDAQDEVIRELEAENERTNRRFSVIFGLGNVAIGVSLIVCAVTEAVSPMALDSHLYFDHILAPLTMVLADLASAGAYFVAGLQFARGTSAMLLLAQMLLAVVPLVVWGSALFGDQVDTNAWLYSWLPFGPLAMVAITQYAIREMGQMKAGVTELRELRYRKAA